jgi:hypothetical protein
MGRAFFLVVIFSASQFAWGQEVPVDPELRLRVDAGEKMRFGIVILKDEAGKAINKRLTYSTDGATNSAIVRIDGKDYQPGSTGAWTEDRVKIDNGLRWIWRKDGLRVTQIAEVVPQLQPAPGQQSRFRNVCRVQINLENEGGQALKAGIRLQVDTLIGSNDGVPFAVPGVGLVTTFKDFPNPGAVPDFAEALEKPDLKAPGTVGHFRFKIGEGLDPPDRVSLTGWPGSDFTLWDVPVKPFLASSARGDSAVVLYWNERSLAPGESRRLGFSYGLGAGESGAKHEGIRLTLDGQFEAGQSFSALATVQNPTPGQTVQLQLPPQLQCTRGNDRETVPTPESNSNNTSVVSWTVQALEPGNYKIHLSSSTGGKTTREVTIAPGKTIAIQPKPAPTTLALHVTGVPMVGKTVILEALIGKPTANQRVKLTLPAGLSLAEGEADRLVPLGAETQRKVSWAVRADRAGDFAVTVQLSDGLAKKWQLHVADASSQPTGPFTALDAQRALKMAVKLIPVELRYDLDGDGQISSRDAVMIMRRVVDGK